MPYVQAIISLGLFGWLGYAVAFDALPTGDGGSGKTRALQMAADTMTDQFGAIPAGSLLAGFGVLLAVFFISRAR